MISSDYIIRMIEQIGTMLQRILKGGSSVEEVYLDDAYMKYLGVNKKLIDRLTADDIARVLCPSDMSMAAVAAFLLYEDAQLCALKGETEKEQEYGRKAYRLMQHFLAEDPLSDDDLAKLDIDKFEKYAYISWSGHKRQMRRG